MKNILKIWLVTFFSVHAANAAMIMGSSSSVDADNSLRFNVSVITNVKTTVSLAVWEFGDSSNQRTFLSAKSSTKHKIPVYFLKESTRYIYRIRALGYSGSPIFESKLGSFTTSALPAEFPEISTSGTSASSEYDHVLFNSTDSTGDGLLLIADREGEIIWYQKASRMVGSASVYKGFSYDADSERVLAIIDDSDVVIYDMNGDVDAHWSYGAELNYYSHHDIFAQGDDVYVLVARETYFSGTPYVEDGFVVLDDSGTELSHWFISDGGMSPSTDAPRSFSSAGTGYWSAKYPSAIDWTHGNSIHIFEDGGQEKMVMSLKHLHQVIQVDVASSTIDWRLGHSESTSVNADGDFTMSSSSSASTWFAEQHHATLDSDGNLTLFNNSDEGGSAELLKGEISESAMEVNFTQVIDLGEVCSFLGSNFTLDDGTSVGTCGPEAFVSEYDSSGTEQWQMTVSGGSSNIIYRGQPIDL